MQLLTTDINWCVRRLPDYVRALLAEFHGKVFIAGGFIRSCIANEPVNDIDIFVADEDVFVKVKLRLLSALAKQVPTTFTTDNAFSIKVKPYTLQIITKWKFTLPEDCIWSFDFTIAQALIYHNGREMTSLVSDRFYPDLAARRLHYTSPKRIEEVGGSILRMLKFYQRGYRIDLPSLGAVCARLESKLDRINPNMGEDREAFVAKVFTGFLFEVDPNSDFDRQAWTDDTSVKGDVDADTEG